MLWLNSHIFSVIAIVRFKLWLFPLLFCLSLLWLKLYSFGIPTWCYWELSSLVSCYQLPDFKSLPWCPAPLVMESQVRLLQLVAALLMTKHLTLSASYDLSLSHPTQEWVYWPFSPWSLTTLHNYLLNLPLAMLPSRSSQHSNFFHPSCQSTCSISRLSSALTAWTSHSLKSQMHCCCSRPQHWQIACPPLMPLPFFRELLQPLVPPSLDLHTPTASLSIFEGDFCLVLFNKEGFGIIECLLCAWLGRIYQLKFSHFKIST